MKTLRVGIIGTNGLPGKYGGWDQLVHHLTFQLRDRFHFVVYGSSFDAEPGLKECNGARLVHVPLKANGAQSIIYDLVSCLHAVFTCDVLFICGTSGCVFLPFIRLFGRTIVVNPDGLEWLRGKWSRPVKWFLKLSERFGVRFADRVIADNQRIADYIEESYGRRSRTSSSTAATTSSAASRWARRPRAGTGFEPAPTPSRCAASSRRTTSTPSSRPSGAARWTSWWWATGTTASTAGACGSGTRDCPNLKLLDPIYTQGTLDELRSNCGVYVHGHSVGGTNPSLVEAMSLGLCVAAYDVEFNRETTERAALYFAHERRAEGAGGRALPGRGRRGRHREEDEGDRRAPLHLAVGHRQVRAGLRGRRPGSKAGPERPDPQIPPSTERAFSTAWEATKWR